jgi:hypothetical protein
MVQEQLGERVERPGRVRHQGLLLEPKALPSGEPILA